MSSFRYIIVALIVLLLKMQGFSQSDSLKVWVSRTVSPETIYYEGAGGGDTAKVTIRAWASTDTLKVGSPLDIILLVDRSWSMRTVDCPPPNEDSICGYNARIPGDYTTALPISRIQGAFNAISHFVDRNLKSANNIRTAFLVVSPKHAVANLSDTANICVIQHFQTTAVDPGYANLQHKLDLGLIPLQSGSPPCGGNSSIRKAINDATTWALANKRPGATPLIIAVTDARLDEGASDYNTDSLVKRLNTLNAGPDPAIKVYTIAVSEGDTTALRRIATAGKGKYAFSQTGAGLDAIFDIFGQEVFTAAAIQINANVTPMFIDVLGKDIHYVPGSLVVRTDSTNYIAPTRVNWTYGTVNSYTGSYGQFKFDIDTINVGEMLVLEYQITAALREFNPAYLTEGKRMAVNNYKQDDSVAYSRFKYKTIDGSIRERPIAKSILYVKTKVAGVFISTSGSALSVPDPSGNKTITLMYSIATPGTYGPENLYGILKVDATGISQYSNTAVNWEFAPNPAWTMTGDTSITSSQPPAAYRLVGLSVKGNTGLQDRDTLRITSTDGLYSDFLAFRAVYVDRPYVAGYVITSPSPAPAGSPIPVTCKAVDVAGNVITDPSLMPDSVCVYSSDPVRVIRSPGDTVTLNGGADRLCGSGPFVNGQMTMLFYSTKAESLTLQFMISKGNIDSVKTAEIVFIPGAPDRARIVYRNSSTDAVLDTLSSFGTDNATQRSYAALLYDRYGNQITDPTVFANIGWQANQVNSLAQISNEATYSARGTEGNYWDTLTVSYKEGTLVRFSDRVLILVLPIVKVLQVVTHEWLPDTVTGLSQVRFMLDSVLSVSADSLHTAAASVGMSRNEMYLETLRQYGYASERDGYLDYLDIILSTGMALKSPFIRGVFFDTLVSGKPDTVAWAIRKTVNGRALQSKLTVLNSSRTQYRLWLISNATEADAPMETGFLPKILFDNAAIQNENVPPLRLGNAENEYLTPASVSVDSAAPVVNRFIFQNNKCNPDRIFNTVHVAFSEPVRLLAGSFINLRALTLVNGTSADSTFTLTAVNGEKAINRLYSDWAAWNLENLPGAIMTYELEIRLDKEDLFRENITRMRFSVDSASRQITDAAGNNGCAGPNRPATLENDQSISILCNVSGQTLVDRNLAVNFTWGISNDPGGRGEPVPNFAFFGFEVNLSTLTAGGTRSNDMIAASCGRYIFLYNDPTAVFVSSEVRIFDLLGNMVASPKTNKSLKVSYTVAQVMQVLGMDPRQDCSSIDTSKFIVLAGAGGAPDTLIQRYPSTLALGYESMKQAYLRGENGQVVPSWNCLNAKGRLVAPGGYVVVQTITALGIREELTKKLIVTSRKDNKGL